MDLPFLDLKTFSHSKFVSFPGRDLNTGLLRRKPRLYPLDRRGICYEVGQISLIWTATDIKYPNFFISWPILMIIASNWGFKGSRNPFLHPVYTKMQNLKIQMLITSSVRNFKSRFFWKHYCLLLLSDIAFLWFFKVT